MKKTLFIPVFCFVVFSAIGQVNHLEDSVKKEVPPELEELVREYERLKKEKEALIQRVELPMLEIDGIVMDESMSKSGREFYEVYFSLWRKPRDINNFYIKIKERPYRMNITLIEVYFRESMVYQAVLQRRYDDIVEMARNAISQTNKYIWQIRQANKALNEKQ